MRLTESNPLKDFVSLKYKSKKPIFLDYDKGDVKVVEELLNKLGQLEDIEDKLGIDLITLFKALKNGMWIKFYPLHDYEKETIEFAGNFYFGTTFDFDKPIFRFYQREYKLKDYGKTWALTKEELENE